MNEKNRRDDETECRHPVGEWISVSVDKAILRCVCCGEQLAEATAAPPPLHLRGGGNLIDLRHFGALFTRGTYEND